MRSSGSLSWRCQTDQMRRSSNPLDHSPSGWQRGVEPTAEPVQQQQREEPEQDYSITNAEWMLQCRAVAQIKRRYGIKSLSSWTDHHDRLAMQLLREWRQPSQPVEQPRPRLREGFRGSPIPW